MKYTTPKTQQFSKQKGSVLIEALIGILIFSAGILALIGLQAVSIKNSSDAQYRTEAALFANELIGQMWVADKNQLTSNFSGTGSCTSGGASYRAWCIKVVNGLKDGRGAVISMPLPGAKPPTVTVAAGNNVTITINWQPPGTKLSHQYQAVTQISVN